MDNEESNNELEKLRPFAEGVGKTLDEIIGRKIWNVFKKDEADKRFAIVKD